MAKILVAEDDGNIRTLLEAILTANGYGVDLAADGAEALEKARVSPPDLIISDVMMPEMDGFMFCRSVKADERLKKIPFILYTATNSEKDEVALAGNIGAARFISKPGQLKDLLKSVSEELSKVRAAAPEPPAASPVSAEVDREYLLVLLRKLRAREKELEEAKASLLESEERLKNAQAMAHVGHWELDLRTHVLLASEEAFRIYGVDYKSGGLPLETVQAAVLPDCRPGLDQALKKLVSGQGVYNEEFRIIRAKTGELRHLHSKAELVRGPGGEPLKVAGILQDITEAKQVQEALRQAQKLDSIGQLSGGIAHDINNLLGPILGYADFLGKSLQPGDARLADIGEIVKAADRAAGLVRKLLAFSRRQVLEPKVVSLNTIISEMGRMLERVIGERLTLNLKLEKAVCPVRVDPGQVEQVLLNLVLNARDAMEKGGEILIETSAVELRQAAPAVGAAVAPGRYVVLSVRDSGCGMDEATRVKIFEPFFTTKGLGKGMGLGLSSVYGIVKQSGGEIRVESAPGKGSDFIVYFPCSEEEPSGAGPAPMASRTGTGVVLLVEDDETMRRIATRILAGSGYSVLEAADGREALKLLESDGARVALLLTDIAMPEMDGAELSLEVFRKYPHIKVLCMSGYADKETEIGRVLGQKAEFIQKPFSPDALMLKVSALLNPGK